MAELYDGTIFHRMISGLHDTAKLTQDDPIVKAGLLKAEIHPWGTGKGVLASGQPMQ